MVVARHRGQSAEIRVQLTTVIHAGVGAEEKGGGGDRSGPEHRPRLNGDCSRLGVQRREGGREREEGARETDKRAESQFSR